MRTLLVKLFRFMILDVSHGSSGDGQLSPARTRLFLNKFITGPLPSVSTSRLQCRCMQRLLNLTKPLFSVLQKTCRSARTGESSAPAASGSDPYELRVVEQYLVGDTVPKVRLTCAHGSSVRHC
jgi:hypothetical protein